MATRILLGPAGSGKTHRCLAEARARLIDQADGPELLFIAPKQATFQLERQLLADERLGGYTRLRILSFERLALRILELCGVPVPSLLDEEGRLMVLRALLARNQSRLSVFHANARMTGFARQTSVILREFQQHDIDAATLLALSGRFGEASTLGRKLHDLSIALDAYGAWLTDHELSDADSLFDAATEALAAVDRQSLPRFGGIWMDGFGELPPKHLRLLASVLSLTDDATLAFCLDEEKSTGLPWHSPWSPIQHAFQRCVVELEEVSGVQPVVETLSREAEANRFDRSPTLARLERDWAIGGGGIAEAGGVAAYDPAAVRVVACATPEDEAVFAAREIRRFVREEGARYRDCAVIVRSLEDYRHTIRRVFQRFEIPMFLDRREPVGRHPLAELTRAAIRIAAFGWRHEDWFCALKTGLAHQDEFMIDRLENEALARGWDGNFWRDSISLEDDQAKGEQLEAFRAEAAPPFARFQDALGAGAPNGTELAGALRELWRSLEIESSLEKWNADSASPIHETVWEALNQWLGNVERAFPEESIPLREWLPILEAGLSGVSVGAIPPAIDQVLVGAIDRSRNPDLRLAIVLGANEGVFPAPPQASGLISDHERERLAGAGAQMGPDRFRLMGLERYYAYIACTRPRERLIVTHAQRSEEDKELNPSSLALRIRRVFPELETELSKGERGWRESERAGELAAALMADAERRDPALANLNQVPVVVELMGRFTPAREPALAEDLDPGLASELYGPSLRTSVSRIERFAACPFRFFADSGMRAEERRVFQIDARERGNFQHEILERFHHELRAEQKRWRDLAPAEARKRVERLSKEFADEYREGLFRASDKNLFTVESLSRDLGEFIEVIVGWMTDYGFDPIAVELDFGGKGASMPAWEFDLGGGRSMAFNGKIDRVDMAVDRETGRADCVVIDYKSSGRAIDMKLLRNGIQIQLPAYLAALWRTPDPGGLFELEGVREINPLGAFYVNLRGKFSGAPARDDALQEMDSDRRLAYQHVGRYSLDAQSQLDQRFAREGQQSGQFSYRLKNDGTPRKDSRTVMEAAAFRDLLLGVEAKLREMGLAVFEGKAAVDPYRHGSKSACDYCEYRPVCRIDPWTHPFRALEEEP